MKLLVLFDIDGTILKLKAGISKMIFLNILTELLNFEITAEYLPSFSGKTDLLILREICDRAGIDFNPVKKDISRVWDKMYNYFITFCDKENIDILPGADKLIESLAKHKHVQLGLLTGNFKQNAYLKLAAYNLGKYFPIGAFGCEEEERNKLAPIAIKRANMLFSKKHFTSENTLIIGDSELDIACARANNLSVLAVATGYVSFSELKNIAPDILFDDFSDYKSVENSILSLIK